MRQRTRWRLALLTALLLSPALPGWTAPPEVVRTTVTFTVDNVNRSRLPCGSDGRRYAIRGELVTPRRTLAPGARPAVTLFLHELSLGGFFWTFRAVPGYDTVDALARKGHASVVVDRLGYDRSGHPHGSATCFGAQADIAAQLVRALRSGRFTTGSGAAPRFTTVVLAGHSVGAGIAELAAHSFPELRLAGLALLAWADQGYSPRSVQHSLTQGQDCAAGGESAELGGPGGYAWFGRSPTDFRRNLFHSAEPAVVERTTRLRNRDPCGDNQTLARLAAVNLAGIGQITAPVLVLAAEEDAVFLPGAVQRQAGLFRSSRNVTLRQHPGTGHAMLLERRAPAVRADLERWLRAHAPAVPSRP